MNTEPQNTEPDEDVDDFKNYEIDSIEFLKRKAKGFNLDSFEFLNRLQEDFKQHIEWKLNHLCDQFKRVDKNVHSFESFEVYGGKLHIETCEFNTSCHCHPEYSRDSYELPLEVADSDDENAVFNYLIEKETEKKRQEAERIRQAQEKKRKEIEERERADYLRLKQKFSEENS